MVQLNHLICEDHNHVAKVKYEEGIQNVKGYCSPFYQLGVKTCLNAIFLIYNKVFNIELPQLCKFIETV